MSTPSTPGTSFIEPTSGHAIRVMWAFAWRGAVFSFLAGLAVGFVIGVVGAVVGVPSGTVSAVSGPMGGVAGLLVGIYVMKIILGKQFRHFRICLLSPSQQPAADASPSELSPTLGLAARFWWGWAWRMVLWSLAIIVLWLLVAYGLDAVGFPQRIGYYLGLVVGSLLVTLAPFLVSLFVMKGLLQKDFKTFSVRLVPRVSE